MGEAPRESELEQAASLELTGGEGENLAVAPSRSCCRIEKGFERLRPLDSLGALAPITLFQGGSQLLRREEVHSRARRHIPTPSVITRSV